ncbi:MAG TPA: hypothetical protein VHZ81_06510 [Galbitalea sp.]|jgi:hypothetical protein|nr:hypothetical protein [Galbitalea sp.]
MATEAALFPSGTPVRFTIIPDDYHVPFAGRTGDGKLFFLSNELFGVPASTGEPSSFIGLFLWNADGSFDQVMYEAVARPTRLPSAQAVPGGAEDAFNRWILSLGDYVLEEIQVAPFAVEFDGVTFGFVPNEIDEDLISVNVEPGDFMAYYEPWDGEEYDT